MEFENLDIDQNAKQFGNEVEKNAFEIQTMKESVLPTMKSHLDFLVWQVENGDANAIEVFAVVKKIEKLFADAKTKIDEYALEEARKYGSTSFDAHGIKCELRSGGKRFDYKNIQEWNVASENLKSIEEKYKLAYTNHSKGLMAVSNDGEVLELPKVSFSKDSLIVKIK